MPLVCDPAIAPRKPLVIAHRGASGLAPENTVAAFKLAGALGADGIEMDAQLTADGHPVIIHDSRVNRTTNGIGTVSRLTLDQLQSLDADNWFERRLVRRPRVRAMVRNLSTEGAETFSIQQVPTLEAALSLATEAALARIYVELKSSEATRQALLEAVLFVVRRLGVERSVTLLSFDHETIRNAKMIARHIRTAATFPTRGRRLISTASIVRAAKTAGVDEVAVHFGLASRRAVAKFHEHGLSVSVWTANSKLAMRRLVACDVDSIMTNFPNRLREVLISSSPRTLLA